MNSNKLRFKWFAILYCLIFAVLASTSALSQPLIPIKLDLYWKHQFEFAGFYAAKQQGLFQQAGFDVSFHELNAYEHYVERVVNEQAHFALAGVDLITSFHQGAQVKLLASYFKRSPLVLLTQPEITSLSQLEGKTIIGPKRLLTHGGIRDMLNFNEVNPFAINAIDSEQPFELFKTKQVVGMIGFISDQPYKLNQLKLPYRIYDPNQYGIATMDMNLISSAQFAESNPDLVRKFTAAANLGWHYALQHPEQIVDLILTQYNSQQKSKAELLFEADETVKLIMPDIYDIGLVDETQIKMISNSLLANHSVKKLRDSRALMWMDEQVFINTDKQSKQQQQAQAQAQLQQTLVAQLTDAERQYLNTHRVLTVQNEQNFPPYNFTSQGKPAGHSIDYLALLAQILQVKFSYVTDFSWNEYLAMFKNNQLDLMVNIVSTPERQQFANFSVPIAQSLNSLTIRKDNVKQFSSLDDFAGKKIAVVSGFHQAEVLTQYYPAIQQVPVNSVLDGLTAVTNGTADAFINVLGVSSYFITQYNFLNLVPIIIANNPHFPPVGGAIATNKHNPLLTSIINKAIALLPETQLLTLSRKWFGSDVVMDNALQLTPEEQRYLWQHPVLTVQNEMDYPPFNFTNNDKPAGYSIDFINLVASKLGVHVEFIQGKYWDQYLTMLKTHQLDAMLNIIDTESRREFARFTSPYSEINYVAVTRHGDFTEAITLDALAQKRIAIVKGYASTEAMQNALPHATFVEFTDSQQAIRSLTAHVTDVFYAERAVANYYIEKNFITGLTLTTLNETSVFQAISLAIAVHKDNPLLLSILQKGIDAIAEPELIQLRKQWLNATNTLLPKISLSPEQKSYLQHKRQWSVNMLTDLPPFSFVSNGTNQGYSIDLMTLISNMLNVDIDYVPSTWTEHLALLDDQKLDVLLNVVNTEQRRKFLNFTQPYLETRDVLVMRTNQPQMEATLASFNGKTLAAINDFAITKHIKQRYPKINLLIVNSAEQALLAVASAKADGYIANEIVANYVIQKNFISNLQMIPVIESETLGKVTLSMAARKDDTMLRSILDQALLAIPEQELIALRKKWFGQLSGGSNTQMVTSKPQKAWLIAHHQQTLYIPELGLPLAVQTEQGFQGIIADMVSYIQQQLAIDWQPLNLAPSPSLTQLASADIVVANQLDSSLKQKFIFSTPISTMPIVAIAANTHAVYIDDLNKLNVQLTGVLNRSLYVELIERKYPALQLIQFDSVASALMALHRGDISIMLCPLAQCSYAMNELGLNNLRIINQTDINDTLLFAVRKDWPELVEIINHVLATMSPQLKNNIYRRWNSREDVLVKTDYSLIWYLVIISLSIIGTVMVWNRRIANYAQKTAAAHDALKTAHEELKNTQQQLVQSEKMASLGTLTAGVAHEINNPTNFTYASVYMMKQEIQTIKQFLKQLAGGDDADPELLKSFDENFANLTELADTAADGTQRIKSIVDNLRTFTRLDSAERKQTKISELISTTVNLVRTQFNDININTEFAFAPSINCYPAKLAQVFMNLLVNACHSIESQQVHSPSLAGRISITTHQLNNQLLIKFQDNGGGMDETTQQRVFEPFFTTKDIGVGTGLGMAISFGIIEEHHGKIGIESAVGQGATISIQLPLH